VGLINAVQVTTNVSQVTNEQMLLLAEAHGMDAGEYRRHLLVKAVDAELASFRLAYGMNPSEWVELMRRDGLGQGS
jgi:hypothetical protein